jgi:transcriptional regulator with XRE-family HTH domain
MSDADGSPLGTLLRHWRAVRGRSQLDLSLDSGVSQRHISFVESGRSTPSRQMLLDLAETLDIPLRDRNGLLLAAGYAPIYSELAWDAAAMEGVTRALDRMLAQHEPFPALIMDGQWTVLKVNQATRRFFGSLIDLAAFPPPRNILRLMFDPSALRPFIADWETVAMAFIQRVHREAIGRHLDGQSQALLESLLTYPGVDPAWRTPRAITLAEPSPVIPVGFIRNGQVLRYFSLVTTVGTPHAAAAQELRLESMFPADEATEAAHRTLFGNC